MILVDSSAINTMKCTIIVWTKAPKYAHASALLIWAQHSLIRNIDEQIYVKTTSIPNSTSRLKRKNVILITYFRIVNPNPAPPSHHYPFLLTSSVHKNKLIRAQVRTRTNNSVSQCKTTQILKPSFTKNPALISPLRDILVTLHHLSIQDH